MNAKKILALALAALMLLSLAACGQSADSTATEAPAEPTEAPVEATEAPAEDTSVTVTDMTGREITLDAPAERVVALTASDCEILYALGAGDLLVGRGEYCDYPAEVLDVPSVQSGYDTNIEQIIALEPQVLLMSTMAQTEEQVQQLEAAERQANENRDAANMADEYSRLSSELEAAKTQAQGFGQRMQEAGKKGYGMFAKHHVFTVENGRLVPVKYPDPQRLSELPGYEGEREKVIANTKALLAGMPANNVLLYGDAGTGKSSAVKAISNEFAPDGLRLVEVKKNGRSASSARIKSSQRAP